MKRGRILDRSSFGALALSGSSAIRLAVQFGMLPVLARLIGPAEYGLVALAMPFILLANVLADGGMTSALARLKSTTRDQEATVFWLSAGIGTTLALACALLSIPMGALLDQPKLPWLIAALSPILMINGLATLPNARIIRDRRFAVFAAGDLIATFLAVGSALAAALAGWGAWSLVVQQLVLWVCKLSWVTFAAGTVVRLHYRFSEAKGLLTFGVHTIGAVLADFASRNLDSILVGAALGTTTLGYYAMAYQIVRVPDMLITTPLYLYIFTAMSRASHDASPKAVQDLLASGFRLASAGLAPLFLGLAMVADLAVPLVLGERWRGAITPMQHLAAAGFFYCLCSYVGNVLMGLGKSALRLKLSVLLSVTTIATVALTARFGLGVVSAAIAGAMAFVAAIYIEVIARDLKAPRLKLLAAFAPAAIGCAAMAAALLAARRFLDGGHLGLDLAFLVALGGVTYAATLWAVARRRLLADAGAFRKAQADGPEPQAETDEALDEARLA